MANCMTCRHNDKKAKYCPVKKVHTDLGYVLNCIAWTPTDEAEMKRLRTENVKLQEMLAIASDMANDYDGDRRLLRQLVRDLYAEYRFAHTRMRYVVLQHEERMRELECRMRELGVEVE